MIPTEQIINWLRESAMGKEGLDRIRMREAADRLEQLKIENLNLKSMVEQLQESNDRTFKSNLTMGRDLEEVKQERDALLVFIRDKCKCDACKYDAMPADDEHCAMCRGAGGPHWNWEWKGAKDTNVTSK